MSCNDRHHHDSDCIADIVKFINELQDAVHENSSCPTGCEIPFLGANCAAPLANTRPFLLYCDCKNIFLPAACFNFTFDPPGPDDRKTLVLFSPFLKVKSVEGNCAVAEALLPDFSSLDPTAKTNLGVALEQALKNGGFEAAARVLACAFTSGVTGEDNRPDFFGLNTSGICFTLDLKCFCAIQCLRDVHV